MGGRKVLFIEGEPETASGNLRRGFEKLLAKKLPGKMPRIKLGGGKKITIDQFKNNNFDGEFLLLVDLDKEESLRFEDIKENDLDGSEEVVFYMVQEMESWFISQPDILDRYFGVLKTGKKVSEKIGAKHASLIKHPKETLKNATKQVNKGNEYHEIRHAVDLLEMLDASKLEVDFPDFKRLIEVLKN